MRSQRPARIAVAAAAHFFLAASAAAGPMAYVPNEGSGTVNVIDTERDAVVAEVSAGTKPRCP